MIDHGVQNPQRCRVVAVTVHVGIENKLLCHVLIAAIVA
jgi:hypothetical protein